MISIVIVNFNLSQELLRCLHSIAAHPPQLKFEVVVVDNCSSDQALAELVEYIETRPDHQLLKLDSNVGFGNACNAGTRIARGRDICFLNPDTVITHDFLSSLLSVRDATGAALIGPGYNPAQRLEFSAGIFPGPMLEFLSIFLVGRYVEAWLMSRRRVRAGDRAMKVDWVLGACMLIDRELFRSIGGFDRSFFLFFEEMDLCKRLSDRGEAVIFAPSCQIEHVGSVSGKRDYVSFTRRFYEGKIRFLSKHNQGLRRFMLLRMVWLQMWAQRGLWSLPWHTQPVKAREKRKGFRLALEFLSSFSESGSREVRN